MTKYSNDQDWETVYEERVYEDGRSDTGRSKRLRRNKIDGVLGGVCAGLGDYFGIDHTLIRIMFVAGLFMTAGAAFWGYVIMWVFIPKDKRAPYRREYREARRARRDNPAAPVRTASFRDVKSKFRSVEIRLQDLERSITSKEWKLRRDFRDLEG